MSEGWSRSPGTGTEIDADTQERSGVRSGDAGTGVKGGWEVLPPHPDGAGGGPRYRAPWATGTTASVTRTTPAPAAEPAPEAEAPAKRKTRRFSLKRKAAVSAMGPESHDDAGSNAPEAPEAVSSTPTGAAPPVPPETSAQSQAAPSPSGSRAFEFTGSAGEYFRVWIVNVCLTVLTLGIYSAWAKVRTKRYLYRHTRLEGSPFDYLANPVQILKGRAAVVVFFGLYGLLGQFVPPLQGILGLAMIFLVPWAVVKSLKFRTRNAAWRNIRLGFDGTYKEAMAVFIGWPIAVAFTLGLAYPYYQWRRARFVTERSRFGTAPFDYHATPGEFYRIHMKIAGLVIAMLVVAGGVAGVFFPMIKSMMLGGAGPVGAGIAVNVAAALCYLMVWTYARARLWNLVWDNTAIGPHKFESTVRARDLFRLYVMNTLGIIVSLGLLIPWARVRMTQYRVEHMHLTGGAAITEFAQGQPESVSATGAEFGEALDLDLSF
jgi:uncharacterized membrane protein YjgN (DUF898 family)